MKKKILILFGVLLIIFTAGIAWVISLAFNTIKPGTEKINSSLETSFSKVVRIPIGNIPRPSIDFSQTTYLWEMETLDREIIEVRFSYTPAYTSEEKDIFAVLEMTEKGDPSIFDKVLPALVADEQSLNTARDPQKANFGPNDKAGYSKLEIAKDIRGDKTIKIKWTYEKNKISENFKGEYQKLEIYPKPVLEILYSIPSFLVSLVKG